MDAAIWQRARAVFEAAVDQPPAERDAFVARQCGGDLDLLREVQTLLRSDADTGRIGASLERGAVLPAPRTEDLLGGRIGSFRVLRLLGSGGMGAVYEAEQHEPRRRVALKVMAVGLRSPAAVRRFRWEAEVLARLQHPGIAQVHEVGVHDASGLEVPWFAMELVDGARDLTAYADAARLDLRARIELLFQVADAVHHGHLQGVVHRDLKPANLLVDRSGRVKVIDFGIARCTDQAGEGSARTMTGFVLGTLQHMSPEQLAGGTVDLRCDVYSLGTVAFELLSGRTPHDLQGRQPLTAARIVIEQDARRLRSVRPDLDADLDAILGMALAREPQRRYASVAAFAADLRAFLNHLPVQARPTSSFYQVRKFARRHRALVGALLATVAVLAAGLAMAGVQNGRIERERVRAERVATFARSILASSDVLQARGVDYTVREALDEAARHVADEPWTDALAEADVHDLIGETYRGLSLPAVAEPHLRRAAELRRAELGAGAAATLEAELGLALAVRDQGRLDDALAAIEDAHRRAEAALGADHEVALSAAHDRALLWKDLGRLADAERGYRQALAARERVLGPSDEQTLTTMHTLATLLLAKGDPTGARELLQTCIERRRAAGRRDDAVAFMLIDNLGEAWRELGDLGRAEALHREALAGCREQLGDDHATTIGVGFHLLKLHFARGDGAALRRAAEELLPRCERRFGADAPHTNDVRMALAAALTMLGEPKAALEVMEAAHAAQVRHFGPRHPVAFTSAQNLATARLENGDGDGALQLTQAMVEQLDAGAELAAPEAALTRFVHGRALAATQRLSDAEQSLRAARDLAAALPADHRVRARITATLAAVCERQGKAAEAAALRSEVVAR